MSNPWSVPAKERRLVELNIGHMRGRHTVSLAIDAPGGRRTAHLDAEGAERVSARLADLAYHLRSLERDQPTTTRSTT